MPAAEQVDAVAVACAMLNHKAGARAGLRAWRRSGTTTTVSAGPLTPIGVTACWPRSEEALLTAAGLRPESRCWTSAVAVEPPPFLATGLVAPGGTATGLDVSAPMLRVARARQESGGPANGRFVHADAQTHPLPGPFDVVISRFGTMFFTDPLRAFTAMAGSLRPGGRLVVATWQPPEVNAWLMVPGEAIMRHATTPVNLRGRSMFTQSDPVTVQALLTRAGFVHIRLEDVRVPLRVGADVAEAVEYLAGTGPGRCPAGRRGRSRPGRRAR